MSNIGEASTYFFRVPDVDPKKAFLRCNVCAESSVNIKRVAADVPAVPWRRVVNRSRRERSPANLSLPFWPGRCHKTRMDKHSRASSRRGRENQSGYPPLEESDSLAGKLFRISGLN